MRTVMLISTAVFFLLATLAVAQELEIEKGFKGLSAKISGRVPSGETCIAFDEPKTVTTKSGKEITVAASSSGSLSGLWLGITAIVGNEEIDMKPSKRVKGRFSEKENITVYDLAFSDGGPEVVWVARLWKKKVMSNVCAYTRDDGKMCSYCKKNGYHLEDPVISARR